MEVGGGKRDTQEGEWQGGEMVWTAHGHARGDAGASEIQIDDTAGETGSLSSPRWDPHPSEPDFCQLSFLIHSAEVTLWSIDLQENITACEGAAVRRLSPHIPASSLIIGQKASEVFSNLPVEVLGALGPTLRGENPESIFEVEIGEKWFRIRLFPSRGNPTEDTTGGLGGWARVGVVGYRSWSSNSSGSNEDAETITGAVMVALDITEVKKTYLALEESLLERAQLLVSETAAKDASRTKSEFLGGSRAFSFPLPRMSV
jgi:hypothetical protein